MKRESEVREKYVMFSDPLESRHDVMDALRMTFNMDWTASILRLRDGSISLLVTGSPRRKEMQKDESQLSFSENQDSLGEQSWTSPH